MASKKKPAPKKAAKPAPKAAAKKPAAKPAKPAVSKTVKKAVKPAPKKAVKPAAVKPTAKPATKPVAKPEPPKPVVKQEVPVAPKKSGPPDPKSLVSIKPKVQPIVKKEPPKPSKVVIPKTTTKSSVKYEPDFTKSVLDANQLAPQPSGPTMRYSDSDLVEFREIIQRKLDAAKKELNYLQGLITRKEEGGDMDEGRYMTMEDGSVSMEREQLSQMASRQITFIDHLEKAMMRIENKTYGICRVTGKLIDKARLRAVPHATLSIEAKQMMSK
jgi:RNA polymerase-binding transcription factor DksA